MAQAGALSAVSAKPRRTRAHRARLRHRGRTGCVESTIPGHGRAVAGRQRWSVSSDEAQCACPARRPAGVVRVVDAIHDGHLGKIEWAYPLQAGHVDGIESLVRSSLMMRVDSAARTEEVLR